MIRKVFSKLFNFLGSGLGFVKFILGFLFISSGLLFFIMVGTYLYFASDLPNIENIRDYKPPVTSEVFADDGTRIGEFWTECRIFLPYDKIPQRVKQTFVDSEDSRFFEHKGVDVRSIFRAFLVNLRAGTISQGGSTITQQVTRALVLSREKTFSRKIKEAILATRLERYLSKEDILTLYLNQIYLGNRAYGVAAAARNYFHKDIDELTLGQIALIAGLPSAPTSFSPINNPVDARRQQFHVLERLLDQDHITDEEAKKAAEESFGIYVAGTDKDFNNNDAAYFTEHVRRIVKEKYGDEFLYYKGLKIHTTVNLPMQKAATRVVRAGIEALDRRHGWRGPLGHVPSDKIAQKASELAREMSVKQNGEIIPWPPGSTPQDPQIEFEAGKIYKAVVASFQDKNTYIQIGNMTGVIKPEGVAWARTYVKGSPYVRESLGYDGVTYVRDPEAILKVGDVILARRLADGSFALAQEPLVESALVSMELRNGYIKAMVGGYDFQRSEFNRATQALRQPGSSFKPFVYAAALDKGYTFETVLMDSPVTYRVGRGEVWSPKNYGNKFNGPTTFRKAIQFSRNVPTVKITYDIGTHYLTAYERKMGITSPIEKYLSMALGANAVYLVDMVQAYAVFPNGGKKIPAVAITKIEDVNGTVLESHTPPVFEEPAKPEATAEDAAPSTPPPTTADVKKDAGIAEGDLNAGLFREAVDTIEKDKLVLTDLEMKTLYGNKIPPGYAMTPQTAYLMVDLLRAVVEGGTGTRVKALGKPAGGKTGTTNDETDIWFIGFVPDLIAGVWVGFDEVQQIGKGITGGSTASPIFLEFMKSATEGWEAKDFAKPPDFPEGNIARLSGGSAIFGAKPTHDLASVSGADRAGRFFEEDLEETGEFGDYAPPVQQPTPDGQGDTEETF